MRSEIYYKLLLYCREGKEEDVLKALAEFLSADGKSYALEDFDASFVFNDFGIDDELIFETVTRQCLELAEVGQLMVFLWNQLHSAGLASIRLQMRGDTAEKLADFVFPIPAHLAEIFAPDGHQENESLLSTLELRPSDSYLERSCLMGEDDWFVYRDYSNIDELFNAALAPSERKFAANDLQKFFASLFYLQSRASHGIGSK